MSLPLALLTFLGHQPLGLIASLGGFTALYAPTLRRAERLRVLPLVGAGLVVASTLGVACAAHPLLMIVCLTLVSAVACLLTLGVGLGPPGPIMFVLVAAVSGQIAVSVGGSGSLPAYAIPALVAFGSVLAYLVVIAPLLVPSVRRREGKPSSLRALFPRIGFDEITRAISIRVVSGVALTSVAGWLAGGPYSYWIMIPAVAVLQASHERRLTIVRAVQRTLGTIVGVGAFVLLALLAPKGFWLVATIASLQFAFEVVVARNYGLALIFITPAALMIATAGKAHDTVAMVQKRVVDTVAGVAIAMLVFAAWELLRRPKEPLVDADRE